MKPSKMLKTVAREFENKGDSPLESMIKAVNILETLSDDPYSFFDFRRTASKIFKEEHGQDVEFSGTNIKFEEFMQPELPESAEEIYKWEEE